MCCHVAYIIVPKILWASFCVISFSFTSNPNICWTCFFSFSEVLPACIDAKLKCSLSTKAFGSTLPLPSISLSGSSSSTSGISCCMGILTSLFFSFQEFHLSCLFYHCQCVAVEF